VTAVQVGRSAAVDAVRGLAVLLMVGDHLCATLAPGSVWAGVYRLTLGRLAMPLFFLLSGSLVRRLSWRHAGVLAVGLVLPVLAPWVDAPNVLVWYAAGAALLVLFARQGWPLWLLLLPALVLYANGWTTALGTSYQPWALFALMAVGQLVGRQAWARMPSPGPLRLLGRWPLSVYVGHVLALTVIAGWAR
jgi:hypothetical protein